VQVDTLILGGVIVTMDHHRRVIRDGAIAIKTGRIVDVGDRQELQSSYKALNSIDASGRTVIPGLINGHAHIPT